jgi:hypothetical protein
MSEWRGHGQLYISPFQDKESCVERFYPDPNGFVSRPASSCPAATNCLFLTSRRLQKYLQIIMEPKAQCVVFSLAVVHKRFWDPEQSSLCYNQTEGWTPEKS